MCGICGFITTAQTNQAAKRDRETLKLMCAAMAHRGPDGEGFYQDSGIALGHRRLSLVDLESGGQPMVRRTPSHDSATMSAATLSPLLSPENPGHDNVAPLGDYAIVFNGEIYNHRALAARLEAEGWRLDTHSDTEVILVGYVAWGARRLLEALEGMFAFALWDRRRQELFCARDPFGIKPLYYAMIGGRFVFASEVKAILEYPGCVRQLNRDALAQYLCFQFNPLDETFFKGIFKLPPGCWLVADAKGPGAPVHYWEPHFFVGDNGHGVIDGKEALIAVDDAVRASVERHAAADVEVGSLLSGGVDSSYVCGCLANDKAQAKTFTVGFGEFAAGNADCGKDEVASASSIASRLGAANFSHRIDRDEYLAVIPHVQWHMDEPLGDPAAIALYYVNQLASRQVKAVLSGEGADELFGGYRVYGAPAAAARLRFVPQPILAGAARVLRGLKARGSAYLERASASVENWYYTNANGKAFSHEERARILRTTLPEATTRPQEIVSPLYAKARNCGFDDVTSMQLVDVSCWLVNDILLKADKMSMAHSVECRVPYLDRTVFSVASRLSPTMKASHGQTKRALRAASLSVLPNPWANRDKLGFPVPLAGWLRQEDVVRDVRRWFSGTEAQEFFCIEELLRLVDDHCAGEDRSRRIWIVWMFLVWHRVYFAADRRDATVASA